MKKLILFVVCFLVGSFNVFALENDSNVTYEFIDNIYSNRQIGEEFYTGEQGIVYVNGRLAYCLDPTLTLKENIYSSSTDFSIHGIDENTLNYLEMVSYFGYGSNGRNAEMYYLAAQEIIWEYLSGGDIYWTAGRGGEVLDISYYKSEILTSINEYSLLSPNIPTYVETYQHEDIVLNDNNNVLKYYKSDSWSVTIHGNTLTLNSEFKGTTTVKLTKQPLSYMNSYIYYCNGSQTLATFGYTREEIDTIEITHKVKNRSKISIEKQDLFSQKIIKNKETKIRIYDVTRGEYITENGNDIFIIGSTGILELNRLFDEGEYQIEEVEAPIGYKKAKNNHTFYIREYDGDVKKVILYNQPIQYDININKKHEVFIGIVETPDGIRGEYLLENAYEVIYGLYADENIYDASGEALYEVNTLVAELVIENGKAQYIGIPYGNYYLKELNCNDKYELDTRITKLSLTGVDNVIYLDFINYLKKGNITITKVNNDIPLAGAEFKISSEYYLFNEIATSNNFGLAKIETVPYDTYYITEIKAPEGYILDTEEKMISLNSSEYNYQFHNEKEMSLEKPSEPEEPIFPDMPEVPAGPEEPKQEPSAEPEQPKDENLTQPDINDSEEKKEPEIIEPIVPEIPDVPTEDEEQEESESATDKDCSEITEDNNIPKIEENIETKVENPSTHVKGYNNNIMYIIVCICILLKIKKHKLALS